MNTQNFDHFLALQRVRHLNNHNLNSLLSNFGVIAITAAILWQWFNPVSILIWAVIYVLYVSLGWRSHNFRGEPADDLDLKRWITMDTIGSFGVGFLWGIVPVLFFQPDDATYAVLIIAIFAGFISGSHSVTFAYWPSFASFAAGIGIPFIAKFATTGIPLFQIVAALAAFYIAMLAHGAVLMHNLFIENSHTQFDNQQLVRDLAKEKRAVEQAVGAKDRFLAAASHDLRQPLNAVNLFVDVLAPMQTQEKGRDIISKIRKALFGLNSMLHSLLDISKLDAGSVENNPNDIALGMLVQQLFDEYREKAPHLKFVADIDEQIIVHADPTVLYRIVRNLIDNAAKYTHQGQVEINAQATDTHIALKIKDTGIGIPNDKLELVFDEFEQLNNPERNREKGLGLGLAIVQRLAKLADVNIQIDSEVGLGTLITLDIPKGRRNLSNTDAARELNSDFSSTLALVIDNEHMILESTSLLLEGWGCEVVSCDSYTRLHRSLATCSRPPDLILSDLRLGGANNGIDAIELVREEFNRDIPAILITGDTAPGRIQLADQAQAYVLYKPIDSSVLEELMVQALQDKPRENASE